MEEQNIFELAIIFLYSLQCYMYKSNEMLLKLENKTHYILKYVLSYFPLNLRVSVKNIVLILN